MSDSPFFLEVRDFVVRRGDSTILDVPSLAVRPGEILSLIGPNGAGKSTLLLGFSGIVPPESGKLLIHGRPLAGRADSLAYRRRIAMVFQEPLLFKASVFDNVAAGLRIRGLGKEEIGERVTESLDRFRVGHLSDRSAKTLSGGEAQRTSLARALATRPEILLLDEPFAALDPPTREALIDDLEVTLRQLGTTTVMATHDRQEALRLSDRIAVMGEGRIRQVDVPGIVMNAPSDEFVASFVGVETTLEGWVAAVDGGVLTVATVSSDVEAVGEARIGERVLLCIRPEHVTLLVEAHAGTSVRNHFRGTVTRLVPQGPLTRVVLDCGFPLVALVTPRAVQELSLAAGILLTAAVKATAIHVIRKGPGALPPMVPGSRD